MKPSKSPLLSRAALPSAALPSALLLASLALAGCSSIGDLMSGDKVNYKSAATKGQSLEVPPDLSQLSRDSRYVVPGQTATASNFQATQAASPAAPTAAAAVGDVRIERSGNQRWLVVNRPADKLWEPVRSFWTENGFNLNVQQQDIGILETDFAENRAKLPQDIIRATLGRVLDSLYSTGERDKFRTRLERTPSGGTEIFISHRGMIEVNSPTSGSTVWQPRPADPELEAEFLRRLMVKLGVDPEQAKALAATEVRQTSRITNINNVPTLQVADNLERAWRRVGLALDRTGFTVEDRDRSKGVYFVRYVAPVMEEKKGGFFSNLFGGSKPTPAPLRYRVVLRGEVDNTQVSVLNEQGQPETSANAQRIVQVLADDLK